MGRPISLCDGPAHKMFYYFSFWFQYPGWRVTTSREMKRKGAVLLYVKELKGKQ